MYILTIGRAFPERKTGMIGIFELEQATALAAAGNKVVYAFSDNRSIKILRSIMAYHDQKNGVEIYGRLLPVGGLPETLFNKIKTSEFKKLMNTIIEGNGVPDIVHVHFPLITLTVDIFDYLKSLGCKVVCTEHWTKVQQKELSSYRVKLLELLTEKADAFICVSSLLKKSVVELTDTRKKVYVIPNMVSDFFHYTEKKEHSTDVYSFVSVSRLVPVKRFNVVINAFSKAFKDNPKVRLIIVGDGELHDALHKQIDSLQLQKQIEMTGFKQRNEVAEILAESDCYVSASILETFGVPFIEAWVTGIPSIGVRGGPIDEYFTDENGLLFEGDNPDSLAEAMKKVYANSGSYDRKRISQKAVSLFSSKSVAAGLMEVFENDNENQI